MGSNVTGWYIGLEDTNSFGMVFKPHKPCISIVFFSTGYSSEYIRYSARFIVID